MKQKTALITGASRGLGKELAFVFANNGYDLILQAKKNKLPEILRGEENIFYSSVYGDLGDKGTIEKLIKTSKGKEIDVFINNAGMYSNKLFSDISLEECEEILNVNLIAPIILTKGIWEIFKAKNAGTIININSTAGKFGSYGESVYSASKHGMSGFLKSLQFEVAKYNIQIIDVFLGAMKTEMTQYRKDTDYLMMPSEVAKYIYSVCLSQDIAACKTARITELNINRNIY